MVKKIYKKHERIVGRNMRDERTIKLLSTIMNRVKDIDSLYDFIGYVVLCAPDDFPRRDYLAEQDQMNLERAFAELQKGIEIAGIDKTHLSLILEESLSLYKSGSQIEAAHKLQDFQNAIFKK